MMSGGCATFDLRDKRFVTPELLRLDDQIVVEMNKLWMLRSRIVTSGVTDEMIGELREQAALMRSGVTEPVR
jgi:hypothetical protein